MKKNNSIQHCIRTIAGAVVKSRSVYLINSCSGGQLIALKSATALILDRSLVNWTKEYRQPFRCEVRRPNRTYNFYEFIDLVFCALLVIC